MQPGDALLDLDGVPWGALAFRAPREVLEARRLDEVLPLLRAVERAAAGGRWAVGVLAYEAAPALDAALHVRQAAPEAAAGPLAAFFVYDAPVPREALAPAGEAGLGPLAPDVSPATYAGSVARLREAIAAGVAYQVNHTFRLRGPFTGDPRALYERLRRAQGGGLGACLHLGDRAIVSASPELFLRVEGRTVTARPMKGTARRGRWLEEDAAAAAALAASEKDRAENVMIVDLLRNDLGRVAEIGSVRVTRLFDVERYRTVLQLTSTVAAELAPGRGLADLLAAAFPCGSVTGAPKASAMGLIAREEGSPRGAYCGAIGAVAPGGDAAFNVAIRTVELDLARGEATAGVGGGITWGSTAEGEWEEALAKGAFLEASAGAAAPLALVETLRLEGGRFPLLELHLARLAASARHLGLEVDPGAARAALDRAAAAGGDARIRLVAADGAAPRVERAPLPPRAAAALPVALAARPVSRRDLRLFHKTTARAPYDEARRARPEVFDVLLWNEEGELTEFTIGNLVAELGDGARVTPPRDAGLLAGVFRSKLLAEGAVRERTLRAADLPRVRRLWLVNAVRGWVPVRLLP
jgi:para-aminobenzoate synthetase/4-amino-4-deoxychorismate lyase